MSSYRSYREMAWERIQKAAVYIINQKELEQDWIWLEKNLGTREDFTKLMLKLLDLLENDFDLLRQDIVWHRFVEDRVKVVWAKGPIANLALPILRKELKN